MNRLRLFVDNIRTIYERLADSESKALFDLRLQYFLDHDFDGLINSIGGFCKNAVSRELEVCIQANNAVYIYIYGCGHDGILNKKAIEGCGYTVKAFIDQNYDRYVDGIPVISLEQVVNRENIVIVVGSRTYRTQIEKKLEDAGINRKCVLIPKQGIIVGHDDENQYFDFFSPNENEVFVDAGGFDGATSCQFRKWYGSRGKVYIFEPLDNQQDVIKEKLGSDKKSIIIQGCTWSEKAFLAFDELDSASSIKSGGKKTVQAYAIDDFCLDATFIKMDVEGAEYESLKGCRNTIKTNKPKMAICIYHRPEDIIRIPMILLELCKDYKFAIRHYSTWEHETVLYAYI